MNIEGLDYNTQREHLAMPAYGRQIQQLVDYAVKLPTKAERQRCAEAIVGVMRRVVPQEMSGQELLQSLWGHLAIMAGFKLDIDYPVDISGARRIIGKADPMTYPMKRINVRHYGYITGELLDKLKQMEPGRERDELVRLTANQMKRDLVEWSHGSSDDEKVASDMARYTDGKIQLDLSTFHFDRTPARVGVDKKRKRK